MWKSSQFPSQYLWFIFEQKCPSPFSYISALYRNRDVVTWIKLNFQYLLWLCGLWCHVIQLVGTNISDYSVSELSYVISFKKGMYFRFCVCSLPQVKGTTSCHQNPFWILHPCSLKMYTICSVMCGNARHNAYHSNLGWGVIGSDSSSSDHCLMIFSISVMSVLQ